MIETQTKDGFNIKIPNSFHDYKIIELIGSGSTSAVFLVKHETTNVLYSAKVIPKRYIQENNLSKQIKTEISIMKRLDHKNIVKFNESFEIKCSRRDIYIVIIMEYCQNGDLCSYINENGFQDENQRQKIIKGLLSSIKYLHDNSIAHGDIKLENILLDSNFNTKLSDFGYCKTQLKMGDDSKSGTLFYAAPELFARGEFNTLKTDIWSIGISLFCMYEMCFPFKNGNPRYIIKQITSHNLNLGSNLSNKLRRLIEKCTENDADNRPSIDDLMNDEFFDWNKRNNESSTDDESEPSNSDESNNFVSVYV